MQARQDFSRARQREIFGRILSLFGARKDEMLSLGDVRSLLKPESEHYKGMRTVPINLIVGSEGRYQDFNREFLPRHDKLMKRWIRVDMAHLQDVILPPIQLFEIGGVYFVRDGNHRVSVAKAQGAEFIDAEVITLSTELDIRPGMGREDLKRAVIEFEGERFFAETGLNTLRPGCQISFTEVGRYDQIMQHVRNHKWLLNLPRTEEIPFTTALLSWYDTVYMPIVGIIREEKLLGRFPGATESDLYVFIGKHWGELNRRFGPLFTLEEAAEDFSTQAKGAWLGMWLKAAVRVPGRLLARLRG
jgi:hypothetical protein